MGTPRRATIGLNRRGASVRLVLSWPNLIFPASRRSATKVPPAPIRSPFRYYDPEEKVGRQDERSRRRCVSPSPTGIRSAASAPIRSAPGTIVRGWEKGKDPISVAKTRMDAAFEFFVKIQAPFWTFHDRDIAPEGRTLAESNRNLDKLVAHAKTLQKDTGVRLLWGTANLFSNPRYMCGAATNPDAHVFAYAAAQVKKALEVTKTLGGENYVFWGGREVPRDAAQHEPEARAGAPGRAFMHMAVDYAKENRLQGPVPHRAEAEGADQAPVRFRSGQRHRLPAHLRAGGPLQVQHRDQPCHAGRPHLRPRDRGGRIGRDARFDRREFGRPAAGLGHRPVQQPT